MSRIGVMIVDDSAVVRQVMAEQLGSDSRIEVTATAPDPIFAMRHMEQRWPDVIVLDVEMPRMDGITFLRRIMQQRPTPVVICSTLTEQGADVTMQALASGAVDIIAKPKLGVRSYLQDERALFINAITAAAQANVGALKRPAAPASSQPGAAMGSPATRRAIDRTTDSVVVMGTSTGGTQALEQVLTRLPVEVPGIAVVQHMPEKFTRAFAERLDRICQVSVHEASDGDRILNGQVLIAPGGRHMQLENCGTQYRVRIKDGPVVNRHRPSVDVLFRSAASCSGKNALGVIMTGMGDDGAAGIAEMHARGARTLAQDEATCVVYGMPREAIRRGGIERILPLEDIAAEVVRHGTTD